MQQTLYSYILGDNNTEHLFVLIHIRNKGVVGTVKHVEDLH